MPIIGTCSQCGYKHTVDYACPACDAREINALRSAAGAIYDAGYWTCDRPVDETALWEALRDALGRAPGKSPKPIPRIGKLQR